MSDAVLSVLFAGPHVSIQDAGRRGFMRFGVPWSGPMDRRSFAAANVALGNPANRPVIEVSLGGLSLVCRSGAVSFSVAGGGFILEHAGKKRGSWTVATLRAGEKLTIRPGPWGSWCYLAFAGDLQAEPWLGSVSTHALSGKGGGRIATGSLWTVSNTVCREEREGDFPCPLNARPRAEARITIGPQERFFSPASIASFLDGPWRMTDACDRMGVRLAGPAIAPDAALDMPSEAILRGSVQVAGDGVASILLADHQTTGGYPKIATVLDCDVDAVVQLRPRDRLCFRPVSSEQAIAIARSMAESDQRYQSALAKPHRPQD